MKLTRIAEILKMEGDGRDITVKGWVRTKRGNKNVAFIALNDGSCVANIQVVVDLAKIDEAELKGVTTGACLRVDGSLVASLGAGQGVEVQASKIEIYGTADPETYPLQKKGHSLEFLRDMPTSAHVPTPLVQFCESATLWLSPSTSISTTRDSTTCIHHSSQLQTVRAQVLCSTYRPSI